MTEDQIETVARAIRENRRIGPHEHREFEQALLDSAETSAVQQERVAALGAGWVRRHRQGL